ncbi:hypothetical protein SALBM217S_09314 [Streptomyces griseoloalbus]
MTRKPTAHSIGGSKERLPFHMVPIQLKNFTPVGTAMRKLMKEKNGSSTAPVANMWWAHTVADRPVMVMVAPTSPMYPKIGLRENTGMISLTTPKNGSARM